VMPSITSCCLALLSVLIERGTLPGKRGPSFYRYGKFSLDLKRSATFRTRKTTAEPRSLILEWTSIYVFLTCVPEKVTPLKACERSRFSVPGKTTDKPSAAVPLGMYFYLENLAVYADKISIPQVTTDDERKRSS